MNTSIQLANKRQRFRVQIRRSTHQQVLQNRRKELIEHSAISAFQQSMNQNFENLQIVRTILNTPTKMLIQSRPQIQERILGRIGEFNAADLELLTMYQFRTDTVLKDTHRALLDLLKKEPLAGLSSNYIDKCLVYFAITSQILAAKQNISPEIIEMFNIFIEWWNADVDFKLSSLIFYATGAFTRMLTQPTLLSNLIYVLMQIINLSNDTLQPSILSVFLTITSDVNQAVDLLVDNQECIDKIFRNLPFCPNIVIEIIHNLSYCYRYVQSMIKTPTDWLKILEGLITQTPFSQTSLYILANIVTNQESCDHILKHPNIIDAVLFEPLKSKNQDDVSSLYLKLIAYSNEEARKMLLNKYDAFHRILHETEWNQGKSWLMSLFLDTITIVKKQSNTITITPAFAQQIRKKIQENSLDQQLDRINKLFETQVLQEYE